MTADYRAALLEQIDWVFSAHPEIRNHRGAFPWLTGALGEPHSPVWFVGENPSLSQVERVSDPLGGPPTEEAQWWASRGDRLFRQLLVTHGFKDAPIEAHGGWHCYITNVIKQADYAEAWRGTPAERQRTAAMCWSPVFRWELGQGRPKVLVALGKTVARELQWISEAGVRLPRVITVQHYSYVALRPRGRQGPMHPDRVREYDEEFAGIPQVFS